MIFPLSSGSSFSAAINRPISRCHSATGPLANRYLIMKCFIVGSLKCFRVELRAALRARSLRRGNAELCVVIFACDKRYAFAHGSAATKHPDLFLNLTTDCFALARNDGADPRAI